MQLINSIFGDLRTVIGSIVIKYNSKAKAAETVQSRKNADVYMSAIEKKDSFNTYQRFELQAIQNSGVTDITVAIKYSDNKNLIPISLRDRVVKEQRLLIISSYTETNNYYRCMMGLPDVEDLLPIYVDLNTCIQLELDPNIPIHEYAIDGIDRLTSIGYINTLIANNPEKKYLTYLGTNKIDLIRARNARNFSILRMSKNVTDTFSEEFNTIYDQCREYFMSVIYNKSYGNRYDMYDNFISLMIMVMTIQRLISNIFKYGIEYDFYDLSSIKMVFDAYSVPFIQNVPVDYQRLLIRNLNNLLRFKSTDKVIYDICSILGLESVKIYKYFLFKEHKFGETGNPIFAYNEVDDGEGGVVLVEDRDAMYRLFFQSVELKERNLALALADNRTELDYSQVVVEDPYWWSEDTGLLDAIYENEFNFVETKYLSMNIMYKLTEMLFEVSFIFNMLLDKKTELETVTIQLPRMFEDKNINLFTITCMLCALISKKNGMAGNIIHTPSQILTIMGFNFKADFNAIRQSVLNDPHLDSSRILQYIQNVTINSPADVNRIYSNIRDLNDFLVERMGLTQDIDEYRAYRKLFDALMITQHMESLFDVGGGEIATTFIEYLTAKEPIIAQYIADIEPDLIGEMVGHILFRLNMLITDLKHINIINESNSVLLNAAITLIQFFKSYTTDLTSFNILYMMDGRHYNSIKLLHKIRSMSKHMQTLDTSMLTNFMDGAAYHSKLSTKEEAMLIEHQLFFSNISQADILALYDDRLNLSTQSLIKIILTLKDKPAIISQIALKHHIPLSDKHTLTATHRAKDKLDMIDKIKESSSTSTMKDMTTIPTDKFIIAIKEISGSDGFDITDRSDLSSGLREDQKINMSDKMASMGSSTTGSDNLDLSYSDIINSLTKQISKESNVALRDKVTLRWEL